MTSSKPMDTLLDCPFDGYKAYESRHTRPSMVGCTKPSCPLHNPYLTVEEWNTRSQQSQPMRNNIDVLDKLRLMRDRCYSHAKISNSLKDMQDWIDRDYETIRTALATQADGQGVDVNKIKHECLNLFMFSDKPVCDSIDHIFKTYNVTAKEGKE